ncbi:hypothetical protein RN001_012504 [Aquatica leii]|uniref:PHD-type domain-containing protein n=1 Tax=Aquatica leii TaxID=1421715 RepID=A0AAN7PUH3_9COLE|nr:hypothetical protein RN001_012504 [Aquatica leii]
MSSCSICELVISRHSSEKIQCCNCSGFFHWGCVNISKVEFEILGEKWNCNKCLQLRRQSRTFSDSDISMAGVDAGAVLTNRVTFPLQSVPKKTIGLSPITTQTALQTTTTKFQNISAELQFVVKISGASRGTPGLMTVPMNVTSTVSETNNQLTLQSLHGLQPVPQGHLHLKTKHEQYQLLTVASAPVVSGDLTPNTAVGVTAPFTFRTQTVSAGCCCRSYDINYSTYSTDNHNACSETANLLKLSGRKLRSQKNYQ